MSKIRCFTVGDLRRLIIDVPDGTPVVVPEGDHSYRTPRVVLTTGLLNKDGSWAEDFGEELTPAKDYGKRVSILVVE